MSDDVVRILLRDLDPLQGVQARAGGLDQVHVDRLVEALDYVGDLPPVTVYAVSGRHVLVDGFHRREAYARAGRDDIPARVVEGTWRDAVLAACSANAAHGLPRSRADLRKALRTVLLDPEWSKWSDREIARRLCCSPTTVGTVRREIDEEMTASERPKPKSVPAPAPVPVAAPAPVPVPVPAPASAPASASASVAVPSSDSASSDDLFSYPRVLDRSLGYYALADVIYPLLHLLSDDMVRIIAVALPVPYDMPPNVGDLRAVCARAIVSGAIQQARIVRLAQLLRSMGSGGGSDSED